MHAFSCIFKDSGSTCGLIGRFFAVWARVNRMEGLVVLGALSCSPSTGSPVGSTLRTLEGIASWLYQLESCKTRSICKLLLEPVAHRHEEMCIAHGKLGTALHDAYSSRPDANTHRILVHTYREGNSSRQKRLELHM